RVERLVAVEPVRRVEQEPLTDAAGAAAQLRRERREQLRLRGREDRAEAELGGRRPGTGEEQRAGLVAGETVEPGAPAVEQAHAAPRPGLGPQRHTRGLQRPDVPV